MNSKRLVPLLRRNLLIWGLPLLLTIFLFVASFFMIGLEPMRRMLLEEKRIELRNLSQATLSILKYYSKQEHEGFLTRVQAQEKAKNLINTMRYGLENQEYFFIVDSEYLSIMHPFREGLVGSDMAGITDPKGKRYIALLVDEAVKDGETFVEYLWYDRNDATKRVPKLACGLYFPDWNWIIGTGIAIGDLHGRYAKVSKDMIVFCVWVLVIIIVISVFLIIQGSQSERKRLEADLHLRSSEEKYRNYINNAPYGIFISDLSGNFLDVNPAACEISGYSQAELLAMNLRDFAPANALPEAAVILKAISSGKKVSGEYQFVHKDGKIRWGFLRTLSLESTGILGFIIDISERKESEEALKQSYDKNTALFRELQHRVKNSLFTISSLISLESGRHTEPEIKNILWTLRGRVDTLTNLYSILHSSSNVSDTIDLRAYFTAIVESFLDSSTSEGQDVICDLELETIFMDAKRSSSLGLILNELLTNCLKYAQTEGILGKITVRLTKQERTVVMGISDEGPGFPTGIDIEKSSGFGLVLIKQLVQQLDGSIRIENSGGATIRIVIPLEE